MKKKNKLTTRVIPAKAGIQKKKPLDSRLHGNDTVSVHIQLATKHTPLPSASLLKKWCCATLTQQNIPCAEICLRIVDGRESAALNKRYRHKSGATNVLSFPAQLPEGIRSAELGDLVLCAPLVARAAHAQGKTLKAHWAHLVVHGTLHLLGYDHIKKRDTTEMETLEIKILAQLGFSNPYN